MCNQFYSLCKRRVYVLVPWAVPSIWHSCFSILTSIFQRRLEINLFSRCPRPFCPHLDYFRNPIDGFNLQGSRHICCSFFIHYSIWIDVCFLNSKLNHSMFTDDNMKLYYVKSSISKKKNYWLVLHCCRSSVPFLIFFYPTFYFKDFFVMLCCLRDLFGNFDIRLYESKLVFSGSGCLCFPKPKECL